MRTSTHFSFTVGTGRRLVPVVRAILHERAFARWARAYGDRNWDADLVALAQFYRQEQVDEV